MELNNEELFYLIGLINQHLEDNKFTLTTPEFEWRFNLKSTLGQQVRNKAKVMKNG